MIDEANLLKLARMHCTNWEIAAFFDADVKTIERRFHPLLEKGRQEGKISLKRVMWTKALEGNTTMMVWLSKNCLGYTDKVESVVEGKTEHYVPPIPKPVPPIVPAISPKPPIDEPRTSPETNQTIPRPNPA